MSPVPDRKKGSCCGPGPHLAVQCGRAVCLKPAPCYSRVSFLPKSVSWETGPLLRKISTPCKCSVLGANQNSPRSLAGGAALWDPGRAQACLGTRAEPSVLFGMSCVATRERRQVCQPRWRGVRGRVCSPVGGCDGPQGSASSGGSETGSPTLACSAPTPAPPPACISCQQICLRLLYFY